MQGGCGPGGVQVDPHWRAGARRRRARRGAVRVHVAEALQRRPRLVPRLVGVLPPRLPGGVGGRGAGVGRERGRGGARAGVAAGVGPVEGAAGHRDHREALQPDAGHGRRHRQGRQPPVRGRGIEASRHRGPLGHRDEGHGGVRQVDELELEALAARGGGGGPGGIGGGGRGRRGVRRPGAQGAADAVGGPGPEVLGLGLQALQLLAHLQHVQRRAVHDQRAEDVLEQEAGPPRGHGPAAVRLAEGVQDGVVQLPRLLPQVGVEAVRAAHFAERQEQARDVEPAGVGAGGAGGAGGGRAGLAAGVCQLGHDGTEGGPTTGWA